MYLIDFGMSKRYILKDGSHIQDTETKSLIGTSLFCSINAHNGLQQSCRDDLESLGYVLLYFLRGSLPWQNQKSINRKEKLEKIKEKKITKIENICRQQPEEFTQYFNYVKNLKFGEIPDYAYLKKLFKDLFFISHFNDNFNYDWIIIAQDRSQKIEEKDISSKEQTSRDDELKKLIF